MNFEKTLAAWKTPSFVGVFKEDVRANADWLPLQQGLALTSHALTERIDAMVISSFDGGNVLKVKAGIFFEGILTGCSCADDPTPVGEQNEYCEMLFEIDRKTGEAVVTVVGR